MVLNGKTITIATDVAKSNVLCNIAWDKGMVVLKNMIVDSRTPFKDELKEYIKQGVECVFVEDLRILGRSYRIIADTLMEFKIGNVKLVFSDWELDPMYSGFDAVISAMNDLAKHESKERSRVTKLGMAKHFVDPPKKRKLPMKEIAELRVQGLGWGTIAKQVEVPAATLIGRKDDIEMYMEKFGYFDRRKKR